MGPVERVSYGRQAHPLAKLLLHGRPGFRLMLFVELRFFGFFAVAFCVHWLLATDRARKLWLLACSYLFYAAWDWRFLSLILISTLVDYVAALRIASPGTRRRVWLALSLCTNLGLLAVFKYLGFFVQSASELLQWLGFNPNMPALGIVLPVGISFYTFQTLSYTLDVYRKRLEPTRHLFDLALFVAFFPQLVAGPIVRARDFLPQLKSRRVFAHVDVRAALVLFLVGFIKKACIADNLAPIVDAFHANPWDYNALGTWTAVLFFPVQIYCDFSGYSDMAIACSALLGYRLCINFHFPLFAANISDFWRRWHISLSSWVRDYLFIPLGGSQGGPLKTYRNIAITFTLLGLWHGAGWNFVLFGVLHAAAIIARLVWRSRTDAGGVAQRLVRPISMLLTFIFFALSLVVFRSQDFPRMGEGLRAALTMNGAGTSDFGAGCLALFVGLAGVHWINYSQVLDRWWRALPRWAFAGFLGAACAIVLGFVSLDTQPFYYFQF